MLRSPSRSVLGRGERDLVIPPRLKPRGPLGVFDELIVDFERRITGNA